jgi:hypothetical protein
VSLPYQPLAINLETATWLKYARLSSYWEDTENDRRELELPDLVYFLPAEKGGVWSPITNEVADCLSDLFGGLGFAIPDGPPRYAVQPLNKG